MAVLPMFPLGMTVLPGSVVPLHVFEPRYVQLVRDLLTDDANPPEFGIVMIERGFEVGGGDIRADIGTVARVVDMRAAPGGRYFVAVRGVERLQVVSWLPDDPYPMADVDRLADDGPLPGDIDATIAALHERVRSVNRLVVEVGQGTPPPDSEISPDPVMAVYHLAAMSPLGAADRHKLLTAPDLATRCERLASALDDVEAVLEFHRT